MNATLIGIGLYIAVQFAIGVYVARRIRAESDYILAGRNIGLTLGAFSVFATWFGAETVIGSAGSVYTSGLSGAQGEPFAYGAAIILMGLLLAGPLRRRGLTTFADLFRARYGRNIERFAVLLLVPGSILWAAAQIRGFGQIFAAAADIDITIAILIAYAAIVLYTMLGGLLADVYTDFVQGLAVMLGLLVLFALVVAATGHPVDQLSAIAQDMPQRLAMMGEGQSLLSFVEQWAIPICGSLVALELISRLLACRTPQIAQGACFLGGSAYLLMALIPVYLGLLGVTLLPDLADGEQVIPTLAKTYLPTLAYVIFIGALISAILSTVDSALLASSAMVSHNVVQQVRPSATERGKIWTARIGVGVLGTIAFALALVSDSIGDLVELASACGTAGVFVVTMFGMFTRIGGPFSAGFAMAMGAIAWIVCGPLVLDKTAPYTMAVALAALFYVSGTIAEAEYPPEAFDENGRLKPRQVDESKFGDSTRPSWRRTAFVLTPVIIALIGWIAFAADMFTSAKKYKEFDQRATALSYHSAAMACRIEIYDRLFRGDEAGTKDKAACIENNFMQAIRLGHQPSLDLLRHTYNDQTLKPAFDPDRVRENLKKADRLLCETAYKNHIGKTAPDGTCG